MGPGETIIHRAIPVRQWVLTLPYRLRHLLAWDHGPSRARAGTQCPLRALPAGGRRLPPHGVTFS
jgi:hypothetical protein